MRLCAQVHLSSAQLFAALQAVAFQASLSQGFQARILECNGQYLMPYPSRSLYFLLPWPPNPEYLVLPEPLGPKQLHHLHTWPSPGQTQVLQGSLRSKPQWTTRMQSWNI